MIPFATYLYSAVYSGYFKPEMWLAWADEIIMKSDELDVIWYEIACCDTSEKLFHAIGDKLWDEYSAAKEEYTTTEIIEGYYYKRYLDSEIDKYELLSLAGEASDSGGGSMGPEWYYKYLGMLESVNSEEESNSIMKELDLYFNPLMKQAEKQFSILMNLFSN